MVVSTAGVGGGIGTFGDYYTIVIIIMKHLFLLQVIGIEYNFDIPLLISLDFRPEFGK
jgi:hypothetical protein